MARGIHRTPSNKARAPGLAGIALCLFAALVAPAILSACRPTGADHLAAGQAAVDEGRYADAVREFEAALEEKSDPVVQTLLDKAKSLASSEERYLAGLKALAGAKYSEAAQYFSAVTSDHPKYAEAQAALVRLGHWAQLERAALRWGATLDPVATTLTITTTGLGSIVVTVGAEQDDGSLELALAYESPAGVRSDYPNPIYSWLNGQCPAAMVGDGRLVIGGWGIWSPPAAPEPFLAGTGGSVEGWAVDKTGRWLANCQLVDHPAGPKTFDVYVVDLVTMEGRCIASYVPGPACPPDWLRDDLVHMSWNDDGTLLYDSLAGASRSVERWRPGD